MKIHFGILSSKYEMEAEALDDNSKMAMVLFFKVNAPIAIYKPEPRCAFLPSTFFESIPKINHKKVIDCSISIKEVEE